MFQPLIHYLPDLVQQLKSKQPDSPVLAVLSPLLAERDESLTAEAGVNYERIRTSPELTDEQRETWLEVFHFWLMKRLDLTLEEVQEMIVTKLPEVEELAWGKQLKERWTQEGKEEGRLEQLQDSMRRSEDQLRLFEKLHADDKLPEESYAELKEKMESDLRDYQAEIERITKTNGEHNA